MTLKQEAVRTAIARFPNLGARTLARKVMADNKGLFSGFNAAYSAVRGALGVHGNKCRREAADKSAFREPRGFTVDHFEDIPDGLTHYKDWESFQIPGPVKALVISDVHVPFHAAEPLRAALREGKRRGADTVILNGDLCDCHDVSDFLKDPRLKVFPEEIRVMRLILETIRQEFGKARIIYKLGNHEERYIRYLMRQAPILLDLPEFDFGEILRLKQYGVELVSDKRPIALGKLNVIHGHEYRFGISNPVNAARGFFLRSKAHCLGGHFHQTSQHSEKNIEELVVSTWSTGCLCDLHPDYSPINNWNHGFAFVEVDKGGGFQVHNFRIFDGKVYQ